MARQYFRVRKAQAPNTKAMMAAFDDGMEKLALMILGKFENTTATWEHQPGWERGIGYTDSKVEVSVLTGNDQYVLVNQGAPSHPIFPVRAKALSFPGTFEPKSKPGVMQSYPGASGPPQEIRDWVAHPGFEARRFDEAVAKSIDKVLLKFMQDVMLKVAKASGHYRI